MTELVAILFLTLAISVAVAVARGSSIIRAFSASPVGRWVKRSGRDRRRRRVPVPLERRRGPRREEDLARGFLSQIGDKPRRVPEG